MSCSFKCHCGNDLVDDHSTRLGWCYECAGPKKEAQAPATKVRIGHLPHVRELDLKIAAEKAMELQAKSTQVVGWYGHTYGDSRAQGMKTVRGPFCRWFALMEGGDGDHHGKSQGILAPAENDIEYAAFALCNVASIAEGYLALREAIEKPELLEAADWKTKAHALLLDNRALSEANSKKFNALIECDDKIHKLQEEIELLKRNCRLAET